MFTIRRLQMVVATISLGSALALYAETIVISDTELEQLQHSSAQLQQPQRSQSHTLSGRDKRIAAIWSDSVRLKTFSYAQSLTPSDLNWVAAKRESDDALAISNPDHPTQQLTIVDIGQQARATEHLWLVRKRVATFEQRWDAGNWYWADNHLLTDSIGKDALIRWLDNADQRTLAQLAHSYRLHIAEHAPESNGVLASLAVKNSSSSLLDLLWQLPADQASYQALQQVPMHFSDAAAVEIICAAMQNPALQSQALLLLSSHYAHLDKTQDQLVSALDNPQLQWHAAVAMKNIEDPAIARALAQRVNQTRGKAHQMALKMLHQENR